MQDDIIYMRRALELAQMGLGTTYPNPLVGAVIVHEGNIIGEGYHIRAAEAHAEVRAVESVANKSLLPQSTLYVTLEPCSHWGKTPPCCDLIIRNNIKRVVIGMQDPFSKVNGEGIARLRETGCEVKVGVLEEECRWMNRRFVTFHTKKRPYIILKFAQSADGFLDRDRAADGPQNQASPTLISNTYSRQLVHKWRSEEAAILVGTNTAVNDDPRLDVRLWAGTPPLRITLDRTGRIPTSAHLKDGSTPTLIFTETENISTKNLHYIPLDFSKDPLENMLTELYKKNVQSLIVEGGTKLLQDFISQNLWDEARIFTGTQSLGVGIKAPRVEGCPIEEKEIAGDLLRIITPYS